MGDGISPSWIDGHFLVLAKSGRESQNGDNEIDQAQGRRKSKVYLYDHTSSPFLDLYYASASASASAFKAGHCPHHCLYRDCTAAEGIAYFATDDYGDMAKSRDTRFDRLHGPAS